MLCNLLHLLRCKLRDVTSVLELMSQVCAWLKKMHLKRYIKWLIQTSRGIIMVGILGIIREVISLKIKVKIGGPILGKTSIKTKEVHTIGPLIKALICRREPPSQRTPGLSLCRSLFQIIRAPSQPSRIWRCR